jgi:hypothetical protein
MHAVLTFQYLGIKISYGYIVSHSKEGFILIVSRLGTDKIHNKQLSGKPYHLPWNLITHIGSVDNFTMLIIHETTILVVIATTNIRYALNRQFCGYLGQFILVT